VLPDPKAIAYFTDEVVLGKINAEVDSSLADSRHIMGYPTFVMLDAEGNEIDRLVGYLDVDEFIDMFNNYRNGIGTLEALVASAADSVDRTLFYEIADKYKWRGLTENALDWYDKVMKMGEAKDSMAQECLMAIGDMYSRNKEYEKALEHYQKVAADFAGEDLEPQALLSIGHAYRRAKDFDHALKTYADVMAKFEGQVYGNDAEIYRAIAYRDMGDTTLAIKAYGEFVKRHPESEDVEYANNQIAKLKGENNDKE